MSEQFTVETLKTLFFGMEFIKWLRKQAIEEEREISEIVSTALEQYRRSH
jgi:hypothetical protein